MTHFTKWPIVRLETLASGRRHAMVGGPFGSNLVSRDYTPSGVPVIRGGNLAGTKYVSHDGLAFVSESKADALRTNTARPGDIVFTQRGTLGQVALIPTNSEYDRYVISQSQMKMTVDPQKVDVSYLYYYFSMPSTISYIENHALQAGVPHINLGILRKFEIILPRIDVQRKIAAILTAYDDLIETNTHRIAVLEDMADELYREWFVRMRFPGHQKTKFIKDVPEEWAIRPIGELCSTVTDGSHSSPPLVEGGKPMASVKDMHEHGFDLDFVRTISEVDFETLKKGDCQPLTNDVLIAKDGSYLKHVFVWRGDYEIVILSSIAILRPDILEIKPYFFAQVLKQDSTKSMMSGYVSGSALPRIILKDFKKMKLLIPTTDLMDKYEESSAIIFAHISVLLKANKNLTDTRDLLLPRLLSGKLWVEDLDIQLPPSMRDESAEPEAVYA